MTATVDILVDPEDQDILTARDWYVREKDGYVVASVGQSKLYLHIEVMRKHGLLEEGKEVDHKDKYGPKSDCRKANLRMLTHGDNLRNGVDYPRSIDLPRCVYINSSCKHSTRYFAQVQYNGKKRYLGSYDTVEEASNRVEVFYKEMTSARSE